MALPFPKGFVWGGATAALQVEGAADEDARGPSVWDVFCREHPERIFERATPQVACDHYHRWPEDVALDEAAGPHGLPAFDLVAAPVSEGRRGRRTRVASSSTTGCSTACWPRASNPTSRSITGTCRRALGERGGWENADTVERFADYAAACFARFGDRVKLWSTLNEPSWSTLNGYLTGIHPPGRQDPRAAVAVSWNLLRAHARVVRAGHEVGQGSRIGIALNLSPIRPATASAEDRAAATLADGFLNRWFLDPVVLGRLPEDVVAFYDRADLLPPLSAADLQLMAAQRVDFLGVNYYYPNYASAGARESVFALNNTGRPEEDCVFAIEGLFRFVRNPRGRYTDWGWEIDASGLEELLLRVHALRPGLPVFVTENGIGLPDALVGGHVEDDARIGFLRDHLAAVHRAITEGANVRGYYMWSLLDNFSWVNGYKKRYGFLHVDRTTLARTPKKSAAWFRDVAAANALPD